MELVVHAGLTVAMSTKRELPWIPALQPPGEDGVASKQERGQVSATVLLLATPCRTVLGGPTWGDGVASASTLATAIDEHTSTIDASEMVIRRT